MANLSINTVGIWNLLEEFLVRFMLIKKKIH